MLIDTHAHLYLNNYSKDIDNVVKSAVKKGVKKVILPNIDEHSLDKLFALRHKYPDIFYVALGLHPTSVKRNFKEKIDKIFGWFDDDAVAVGETGIDLYHDKTFFEEQKEAFRIHIDFSLQNNKPLIIHSRESMTEILAVLEEFNKTRYSGVFHCYSGNYLQALEVIDKGFYLGIGGVVTYKNSSLISVVKNIPLSKIILETDAPFLSPVPYRGKRNEPAFLVHIAEKIAEIKNVSFETVIRTSTVNARACFNI